LDTLDEHGCLDGMPFMPEMLEYFGRRFRVQSRVNRACDTIGKSGVRKVPSTVLLDDLRCSGSDHGGCQSQCRLYWHELWVRPATRETPEPAGTGDRALEKLAKLTLASASEAPSPSGRPRFRCQATELLRASEPVGWWSVRSFLGELTARNVGPIRFSYVMARIVFGELGRRLGVFTKRRSPFKPPLEGEATYVPQAPQGLEVGSSVRVRPRDEIGRTLDSKGKNRGLWFDREMIPFCGKTARVASKVERFIDEKTGELVELGSDCYILEGMACSSYRSEGRWFCPRAIVPWWRECWLESLQRDDPSRLDKRG
jgi:hypothetical protein